MRYCAGLLVFLLGCANPASQIITISETKISEKESWNHYQVKVILTSESIQKINQLQDFDSSARETVLLDLVISLKLQLLSLGVSWTNLDEVTAVVYLSRSQFLVLQKNMNLDLAIWSRPIILSVIPISDEPCDYEDLLGCSYSQAIQSAPGPLVVTNVDGHSVFFVETKDAVLVKINQGIVVSAR